MQAEAISPQTARPRPFAAVAVLIDRLVTRGVSPFDWYVAKPSRGDYWRRRGGFRGLLRDIRAAVTEADHA